MFIRLKEKGRSASQCVRQTLSRAVEDCFVVPFQSCLVVPSQEALLPWTWNHPMKDSHLEGSAPCGSLNPCWPAPLATAWCLWFRKSLLEQPFPPIYCCRLLWDVVVGKKYSLSARATSSKLIHLVPASRCFNLVEEREGKISLHEVVCFHQLTLHWSWTLFLLLLFHHHLVGTKGEDTFKDNVKTFLVSVGLTNFGGLKKSWRKSFMLFSPFLSGRDFPFLLSGILAAVTSGVVISTWHKTKLTGYAGGKWNAVACTISNLMSQNLQSFLFHSSTQIQLKLMDGGLISNPGRTCPTCHHHKKVATLTD